MQMLQLQLPWRLWPWMQRRERAASLRSLPPSGRAWRAGQPANQQQGQWQQQAQQLLEKQGYSLLAMTWGWLRRLQLPGQICCPSGRARRSRRQLSRGCQHSQPACRTSPGCPALEVCGGLGCTAVLPFCPLVLGWFTPG